MKKILQSPHFYAFITSLCWSMAYVITRVASRYVMPYYLGYVRCVIASITLLLVLLVRRYPLPKPKELGWFAVAGAFGVTLYMNFFNRGAALVTTATGNVILAISPIVIAVAARGLFKEKLMAVQWVAIAVAFAGVVVLTVVSGGLTVNFGLVWLLLAVLVFSTYNLIQRHLAKTYNTVVITAYGFFFGTLFYSFAAPPAFGAFAAAPPKVWLCVIILGAVCSGLAYGFWAKAFSLAKNASTVSNYMSINPFLSAVFGLTIGDPIENSAIYGGVIIMAGIFLFNFGPGWIEKRKNAG